MDFDLAKKHSKEVEQRRREAKRKLEQQKRDEEQRAAMEAGHRERETVRLQKAEEERLRAESEARQNAGVHYITQLRPYPSTRTDDKLEMPASALQELERQGALEQGVLLTFAVSCPSASTAAAVASQSSFGTTHAGVAEFTAEEGTVGVPPRVALCLTKGSGLASLAAVGQVEVRYLRLPRSAKSLAKLQPRGEGFHVGGASAIRMDLQHVLQETLRGHTALSEGDWLPIRHNGITYELVVRALEPEPHIALLDTDLTVEVLPSEQTEAEMRAEEVRQAREEARRQEAEERERLRLERAAEKAANLHPEPEPSSTAVQLMLRLPDGSRLQRRFLRERLLSDVLDWVESEPSSHVQPSEFRLVQKWPGHCRELGPDEAQQSLAALGFARQEALFLQHVGGPTEAETTAEPEAVPATEENKPDPSSGSRTLPVVPGGSAWSEAEERAHEALDRRLEGGGDTPTAGFRSEPTLGEVRGQELVAVFDRLKALGMRPAEAAIAAKKYAPQLKELAEMGFEDWVEAVALLDKYGGRLLRVANLLSEGAGESVREAPQPPPAPPLVEQTQPANPAPSPDPAALEAAAESPNVQVEVTEQLSELAAMGFTDEERNRTLLRKYAGRLERVIEALVSA